LPNDKALASLADLPAALGLLTRLPVRVDFAIATARGARAAWAWPLAGMVIALFAALAASLALRCGLPTGTAAMILIATQMIVTGAMHEDGLADSLDGLWGGWDPTRRLAIMKDSQIGTYGVLGLIVSVILRWQYWTLLLMGPFWPLAIAIGALSRLPMIALGRFLPFARDGGLSHSVGRPKTDTLALATAIGVIVAAVTIGSASLIALPVLVGVSVLWGLIARNKIGGQTGDILGASQQIAEVVLLGLLVALA